MMPAICAASFFLNFHQHGARTISPPVEDKSREKEMENGDELHSKQRLSVSLSIALQQVHTAASFVFCRVLTCLIKF